MLATFSHIRSALYCFIALVFLSVAFMFLTVPSGNNVKPIYQANNASDPVTYPTKVTNFSSRQFMEKLPDGKLRLKKVNVIILSLPRSGSSFLGEVFNHHPRVLYFFEPLRPFQEKLSGQSLFRFNSSLTSYRGVAITFLKNMMMCEFADVNYNRPRSRALNSSPFCIKKGKYFVCNKVTSRNLQAVCKNTYNVTVMKILTPRIPPGRWDKQLLPRSSQKNLSEFRMIHLVRDPRAVVNSLMSLNFFSRRREKKHDKGWFIEKICRQIESDANVGMLTAKSLGARYKLLRFEDLARHPLSVVSDLFQFTRLEMMDGIKQWLYETTHVTGQTQRRPYGTRRNTEVVVSKWRQTMDSATVRTIEKYCGNVMGQLGYKRTGDSLDRQLNFNISLIDKFPLYFNVGN